MKILCEDLLIVDVSVVIMYVCFLLHTLAVWDNYFSVDIKQTQRNVLCFKNTFK